MPSWGELLSELAPSQTDDGNSQPALTLDQLRSKYLKKLNELTGRNIICYYSGFLRPDVKNNIDINDSDITGFMNAIKGMDCSKGLDLILHTPGGNPTATEGIVKYLHKKFNNNIRVIVPHMAMSAGTMLACSAKSILMGSQSYLGPIDPQYSGIPAYNILIEFEDAKKDLDTNPKAKTFWELQLAKYPAAFYYTVVDSIHLSSILVGEWLKNYMFDTIDQKQADKKIKKILNHLNVNNKAHSRHFNIDFCKEIGLNIETLEDDQNLQDAVLSVHHSFIITFNATKITKIIENQNGARYITQGQ